MSQYITYRESDPNLGLQYFILQKDFPHYLCLITEFKILDSVIPPHNIVGYNLWLNFKGTLRGMVFPGYANIQKDISFVMNDMADWFYANRVIPQEKKFKKFKYDSST